MRGDTVSVAVGDLTAVGEARRAVAALALAVGLSAGRASDAAIVVTEAASNIARHAGVTGEVLLRSMVVDDVPGVEVLAIDRGRGITSLAVARRDGFSTGGSQGEGFGAMARQSSEFDVYSAEGQGTIVVARIWETPLSPTTRGLSVGAISLPKPGESACGDSWYVRSDPDRIGVIVADGLGHGLQAADASRRAVELFRQAPRQGLAAQMAILHAGLRSTRGAAVALAEIRPQRSELAFVGVGNINATVFDAKGRRTLVSHNGTVGAETRRIQEFTVPWTDQTLLVAHSDGLSTSWDLARYAGLRARHVSLIGAALYRDHRRLQDDATIVTIARAMA